MTATDTKTGGALVLLAARAMPFVVLGFLCLALDAALYLASGGLWLPFLVLLPASVAASLALLMLPQVLVTLLTPVARWLFFIAHALIIRGLAALGLANRPRRVMAF